LAKLTNLEVVNDKSNKKLLRISLITAHCLNSCTTR